MPGLCPDIIWSPNVVEDPQGTFGSAESWSRMYEVSPRLDADNIYYVRGHNLDDAQPASGRAMLYWTQAQLIMWPSLWVDNPLPAGQDPSSPVSAGAGQIGVTSKAFTWTDTPITSDADGYYSFVTQLSDSSEGPIPPTATSPVDMSVLLARPDLGWRNTSTFVLGESSWRRVLDLQVPASISDPIAAVLYLHGGGLTGATVGLCYGDTFLLSPTRFAQDDEVLGISLTLQPGSSTTLAIHFWNTATTEISPGATLTLSADYSVPNTQLPEAIRRGIISGVRTHRLREAGITPQPTAPLGAATFIAT